jgi:hypothetical protein
LIYKNFDAKLAKPNKVNFDDVKVVKKETQKEESHNNTNKARIRALNKKQAMIDKQLRRSEKQKKRALFLKMLEEEKRLR